MALEAKATLLNEIERDLASELPVTVLSKVLSTLSNHLSEYDLSCIDRRISDSDDLLQAFLSARTVEGKSPKTIDRYGYIIKRMMQSVRTSTRSITVYHLRKYLADEKARGISDRTLEGYRQVFSSYFNWLQRENLIETNPCANLGAIKYAKKVKDIYSDVDLEKMKFGCKTLRDRAIIAFLGATACRISEMVALNRDDIDFANLECRVLGKGNKERTVYLDSVSAMVLQNYLNTRTDELPALFIGKRTNRLTDHGVRQMLVKLGAASNVEHVHPHKFRRTRATALIRHGMPIQEVAAILGHDKLDTSMAYVVLDKADIKASYRKYA